jgi:AraC family transcriptional regulator of adaptative response/methylated-DNA-[protein]-cysteine methyltransferase
VLRLLHVETRHAASQTREIIHFDHKNRIAPYSRLSYAHSMSTQVTLQSELFMANADQRWQAVLARDARHDGKFFYGVTTTGIFCRPTCPSRRPSQQNVVFFDDTQQAAHSGYRPCLRCRPLAADGDPTRALVRKVCAYIDANLEEPLSLSALARQFRRSPFHLQKTFKAALGISPKEYVDARRMKLLKNDLRSGQSVTTALYDAGYSSSSRVYERATSHLGMTPDKYRRGAVAVPIHYTTASTPIGRMLVASTPQGICSIALGSSDDELETGLRREYPFAIRKRDDAALQTHVKSLVSQIDGGPAAKLPLDIQATAFQRRVWKHLQSIPAGKTNSYSEVARAIGSPTATRAVARACATNPVALAIPCHRVVRENGEMGGYRWGADRKKSLLTAESERH